MSARHELIRIVRGADGLPVVGAELRFYLPGTSTPVAAYASMAASSPADQPLVSDSNGRITTYLDPGYYKIVTTFGETTDTIEHYAAADPIPAGALVSAARNAAGELIARAFADGRAIFEANPVEDAATQFLPGGTFNVSPSNPRHRWLKVGDTSGGGALTQNCTIALDRNAGWLPGDLVGIAKGDTSARTVTISGLDADGLGTATLKRSRDFILLICQTTDSEGLKFERGPLARPNPSAEDVTLGSGTLDEWVDDINTALASFPQSPGLQTEDVFPVPGEVESSSGHFDLTNWETVFDGPKNISLVRAEADESENLTATLPEIPLGQAAPVRITEEVTFTAPNRTFAIAAFWTDDEGAGEFTITESGVTTVSLGLAVGDAVSGGPLGAPTTISEIVSDSVFKTVATAGETDSGSIDIVAPAYSIDGVREFTSPDPTGTGGGILMKFVPLVASTTTTRGEIKTGERYDRALELAEARTYLPGQELPAGWVQLKVIAVPVADLGDLGAAADDPTLLFIGTSEPVAGDPVLLAAAIVSGGTTLTLSGQDISKLTPGCRIVAVCGVRKGDGTTTGPTAPALSGLSISGGSSFTGDAAVAGSTSAAHVVGDESCRASYITREIDTIAGTDFSVTATLAASNYQGVAFFFILPESTIVGEGEDDDGISFAYVPDTSFDAADIFIGMAAACDSVAIAAPANADDRNSVASSTYLQMCASWHRSDPGTWTALPARSTARQALGVVFRPAA